MLPLEGIQTNEFVLRPSNALAAARGPTRLPVPDRHARLPLLCEPPDTKLVLGIIGIAQYLFTLYISKHELGIRQASCRDLMIQCRYDKR